MELVTMTPHKKIAIWLFVCCFMVFAMAVIGAITRLTESGLSITEWKPVSGALPPLNEAQWQHQFALYKQSPEFAAKHFWMDVEDFKRIFFWEWLHRLWGRAIGLVFALPLVWFAVRRQIPHGYGKPLLGILALGALQGFVGWFMVASGLVDRPSVSHFRLATHLALALFIYAAMLWTGLSLLATHAHLSRKDPLIPSLSPPGKGGFGGLAAHGWIALAMLSVTIVWGAFVAGLDAGMAYNTFPDMDGAMTPDTPWSPAAMAVNAGWVQFTHRWLALITGTVVLAYGWRVRSGPIAVMVVAQITLGIATLLTQVMLPLAALHQAGAIVLLSLLVAVQSRTGCATRHEQ